MDAQQSTGPVDPSKRNLYQRLVGGRSTDCLRSAHDVARRFACNAGEEYGASSDPRELGRQVAGLLGWAQVEGLLIDGDGLPLFNKGGREHYLVDPLISADRLIKVTIGPEFGFYPCCFPGAMYRDICHWFSTTEATPLQYLRRLLLLNELFPRCDTRLAMMNAAVKHMA